MQALFARLADESEHGTAVAPQPTGIFVPDDDDPWAAEF